MALKMGSAAESLELRNLAPADLDEVVAIDAGLSGRRRQIYFQKRLDAALRQPKLHAQFAAVRNGVLAGYVLARRLAGEFGGTEPALRLEVIGVRPEFRGQGIGRRLLAELEAWGRHCAVREVHTLATWRDHDMLHFLDRAGFHLGRSQIADCAVHAGPIGGLERDAGSIEEARAPEKDYGAPVTNDFEALARDRADVRLLARDDLPAILAIDRRVTGRDREGYLTGVLHEALADSAVRVSLVARREGVTAGFLMAKTDYGDFGRTEPVAVIDTLGVDPEFTGRGIGTAMLSQLFLNLHALRVEHVETVIARENTELLQFFYRAGFAPSERLEFVKDFSWEKDREA
jgi:ribosomal protein S18 acetylase RimI-like enzyme